MEIDGSSLMLSFLVSGVGFVLFSYGKKMTRGPQMLVGLLMMAFPYFVPQLWLMGLIAAALVGLLVLALKLGW